MADLIIVGASVRAAAGSARRAGLVPWCADLFGDADLRALVPHAVRCPAGQYPRALADIVADAPPVPWLYTGALENHPNLVRRLAELRPLWGNGPNALVASRSPFHLERLLREAELPAAEVRAPGAELPDYCRWLRKPRAGAAGNGIVFAEAAGVTGRGHYFQRYVPGTPMSAVFVRGRGETRLVGATEQLIGESWLNAGPFRYCGNVGPIPLDAGLRDDLLRIGTVVGDGCGLAGLFGIDYVLHKGRPWVVEVNPRYPASVEVLERATGVCALTLHRAAFDPEAETGAIPGSGRMVGKAVLYAASRFVMSAYDPESLTGDFGRAIHAARNLLPADLADVPAAGEVIEAGWPVLTVFAEGHDRDGCVRELRRRAEQMRRHLFGEPDRRPRSWYERLDDPEAD